MSVQIELRSCTATIQRTKNNAIIFCDFFIAWKFSAGYRPTMLSGEDGGGMSNRTISFFVSGTPKAQGRPRAFALKQGDKIQVRAYSPTTAEGWKSAIAIAAKEAGIEKFDGPISLELRFNFKRPKSHFRANGKVKETAPSHHTQKPDFDNLAAAVANALTKIGAWNDDAQLARVLVTKDWAIVNSAGGCHITISELLTQLERQAYERQRTNDPS
jgi:Holliday junction resolvase RusA-like endonuclease